MKHHYQDIRRLVPAEPVWWDENGAPRYCPFHPQHAANVYIDEAVLLRVTCQLCGAPFDVAMTRRFRGDAGSLNDAIIKRLLHYGDPPNSGCCPAGATMNSEPRLVLEYWRHFPAFGGWNRMPSLEIDVTPDWVVGA